MIAVLEVDNPRHELWPGMSVDVRIRVPLALVEPFRSMPNDPPPIRSGELREVYACPEHREVVRERLGPCPIDRQSLERRPLAANQRLGWWCPMHPGVTADHPGELCRECGGMTLLPRVLSYNPKGQVLAVPIDAVVDTGRHTVVYVERGPGMFDGVEVTLGPRSGDAYPVIGGVDAGQRVATSGAFLIDAETRLNPSLSAAYFGASRNAPAEADRGAAGYPVAPPADRLSSTAFSPTDKALVARQRLCPVTRKPLGSMGTPVRVVVRGNPVFLCCEGCEAKIMKNPEQYLPTGPREP